MLKLIHPNPRSVTWWINSFSPSHDQHIFVEQLSAKLCITGIHGTQNSANGGRYLEPSCYVAGSNKEVDSITNVIDINLSLFQGNCNYKQPDKFIQIPRNELILLPLTLVWVCFLFRITELVRHKLTTNYQQEFSWDVGNELCWSQHSHYLFTYTLVCHLRTHIQRWRSQSLLVHLLLSFQHRCLVALKRQGIALILCHVYVCVYLQIYLTGLKPWIFLAIITITALGDIVDGLLCF